MIALTVLLLLFVVVSVLAARQAIAFEAQRREEERERDAAIASIEESTAQVAEYVAALEEGDPMVMDAAQRAARDARLASRVG